MTMYYYMAKGSVKHRLLSEDLCKYLFSKYDTDLIHIDIYNYTKNHESLYRLVVECTGKNIQDTKDMIANELGLDDCEVKCFEKDGYVLIYEGIRHEQIVYWYGYVKEKYS